MYSPNSPKDDTNKSLPEWHEPFPEPNTIPSGWNLSSIVASPASTLSSDADDDDEE